MMEEIIKKIWQRLKQRSEQSVRISVFRLGFIAILVTDWFMYQRGLSAFKMS
ncbi:hypothetical protein [Brevibacillus daliensis]|uniref:hypothetical protein n=1 Tax=Brevibacillus daliensis TaxID=2892995 RepID=UPI001E3E728F|nr:hypothetical protein [Brevibacillus daliensis]